MSEVKEETTVTELNEVLEEIVAPQEQEVERVVLLKIIVKGLN